jgi:amidohydrolase
MTNEKILDKAREIKEWLTQVRREFHQYPELGTEEYMTAQKIASYLEDLKIEYLTGVAGTGVVGIIRGQSGGKTVALRADMDALPIEDAKNTPYKSKVKGKMHACGHDAHMTVVLGAARVLKGLENELSGNVKLFFQPAEETIGGAKRMIEEGVMENPLVDVVLGLHVNPEIPTGSISLKYGKVNAASDIFTINIYGQSGHGAYPHSATDAITAAAQVITALQTIVSRNVDPRDCAVISPGTIKGGYISNIIADKVEITGIVRTLSPVTRKEILRRLEDLIKHVAAGLGARGEVIWEEGYPSLINTDEFVDLIRRNAEDLLGKEKVHILTEASLGVEDFAYFLEKTPGAFFGLGCACKEKRITHSLHNKHFDIDEDCLSIGVALQVKNVLAILSSCS